MRPHHMVRLAGLAVALALVSALVIAPVSAAGGAKSPDENQAQNQPSQGNCQVTPDRKQSGKADDQTGSITKKLDKCGGVLNPPDVNDPALVKPAPDAGEMPVIKPRQVPQQAPKQK